MDFPLHCTSTRLNRRRFLQSILAFSALWGIKPSQVMALLPGDFAWVSLRTGDLHRSPSRILPSGMPGSIMKLVATAALMENHLVSPEEKQVCTGSITLHGTAYHCQHPHGAVNLYQALGLSCNVYFAAATDTLEPNLALAYARSFGLNQAVGDYPAGLFPQSPAGRSQAYLLGLSPDLQPNLLQLLRISALIATRGNPPEPFMNRSNNQDYPRLNLSPKTWAMLEKGMQLAGRLGTARHLDPKDRLHLAVKTGTVPHGKTFQSWITGYFPVQAPRYAFCVHAPIGTSQDAAVPYANHLLFSRQWL